MPPLGAVMDEQGGGQRSYRCAIGTKSRFSAPT